MGVYSVNSYRKIPNDVFSVQNTRLIFSLEGETVWIEPWGEDSLRVRATMNTTMPQEDWALTESVSHDAEIVIKEKHAEINNGSIRAIITTAGKITFFNQRGKILLEERLRNRDNILEPYCSALNIKAREFKQKSGRLPELSVRFEGHDEKIYGMGIFQEPLLDLKGSDLELAPRNSQVSIPYYISSRGYGFLWNNPAIGRVTFSSNVTTWYAAATDKMDYWITAAETPMRLVEAFPEVSGKVPEFPSYLLGLWQCKLRYQTQEEVLEISDAYQKIGISPSVIVIDFFHWPYSGEWKFDPNYWPDPEGMIKKLRDRGTETIVSFWPQVDCRSENFLEMQKKGFLIQMERGVPYNMTFCGNTLHMDSTNPGARSFLWSKIKKNYYDKGIRHFWLDATGPECELYDYDNMRYHMGPAQKIGSFYSNLINKTFYEGQKAEGEETVVNLAAGTWAGGQKYGPILWPGDIPSTFFSLRKQIVEGLHAAIAGIPWWTTDIAGFHGGDPSDPAYQELFVRWYQYGTFCPIMRLHGCREPEQIKICKNDGAQSGAGNEIWSYGKTVYDICVKYLKIRERIKSYLEVLFKKAHKDGTPILRALFLEYPEDEKTWEIDDAYLLGPDLLVAPVLAAGQESQKVYLPKGDDWIFLWTQEVTEGGTTIEVNTPLNQIPLWVRKNGKLKAEDLIS